MIEFFKLHKKELILSEKILLVPEIQKLLDFKSKGLKKSYDTSSLGFAGVRYIALMFDFDSPYANQEETYRDKTVRTICFKSFSDKDLESLFQSTEYGECLCVVKNLIQTPEERALLASEKVLNNISLFLDSTANIDIENLKVLMDAIKNIGAVNKSIREQREAIIQSRKQGEYLRGGGTKSFTENNKEIKEEVKEYE